MAGARSTRELAKLLQVSQPTVVEYSRRPDWPVGRRGPWSEADVGRIRTWQGALQPDRSGAGLHPAVRADGTGGGAGPAFDPRVAANVDLLLKRERMLHEKVKRERLEGKLIARDQVDGALGGLAARFVDLVDEMERGWPTRLAGLTAGQIESELALLLDLVRQRIVDTAEVELVRIADVKARVAGKRRGRPMAGSGS